MRSKWTALLMAMLFMTMAACAGEGEPDQAAGSSQSVDAREPTNPANDGDARHAADPAAEPIPQVSTTTDSPADGQTAGPVEQTGVAAGAADRSSTDADASTTPEGAIDPRIPSYRPRPGVSGTVKSVGSDTMNNLMTLWAEGFDHFYPNVMVEIEGKGSSTAPPALAEGSATFGPMSRRMKASEENTFQAEQGYKPTYVRAAIDMLAVYVHKDNPIAESGLTLQQIDAMFSKTRKGGLTEEITQWGQLGLEGQWADMPISLYGRNEASGTYGYFKQHALFGGDYKDTVKAMPGSSAVVQGIARDRSGIGYSGIGYKSANVAVVPVARKAGAPYVMAEAEAVEKNYPLARFLYLYLNYRPGSKLDPLRAEYLKYIFSREGQAVVLKDGYLPVKFPIAEQDLKKVGIEVKPASGVATGAVSGGTQ